MRSYRKSKENHSLVQLDEPVLLLSNLQLSTALTKEEENVKLMKCNISLSQEMKSLKEKLLKMERLEQNQTEKDEAAESSKRSSKESSGSSLERLTATTSQEDGEGGSGEGGSGEGGSQLERLDKTYLDEADDEEEMLSFADALLETQRNDSSQLEQPSPSLF